MSIVYSFPGTVWVLLSFVVFHPVWKHNAFAQHATDSCLTGLHNEVSWLTWFRTSSVSFQIVKNNTNAMHSKHFATREKCEIRFGSSMSEIKYVLLKESKITLPFCPNPGLRQSHTRGRQRNVAPISPQFLVSWSIVAECTRRVRGKWSGGISSVYVLMC